MLGLGSSSYTRQSLVSHRLHALLSVSPGDSPGGGEGPLFCDPVSEDRSGVKSGAAMSNYEAT